MNGVADVTAFTVLISSERKVRERRGDMVKRFGLPEWLITIGGSFFILALGVSAAFIPEIRWLHVVQAALYLAAIVLCLRHSRWGYYLGGSIGGFWSLVALIGSPLFAELIAQPARPDLVLQGLAWLANLAVVIGTILAYRRLPDRTPRDVVGLLLVFFASTAFLVTATAILAPAYLSHLAGVLHPHWPWTR